MKKTMDSRPRSQVRRLAVTAFTWALTGSLTTLALPAAAAPQPGEPVASARGDALKTWDRSAIETLVGQLARDLLVPGVLVSLKTPQGELVLRYGSNEYQGQQPVHEKQHLRVGSNTKTWIGTVILQQVQEGLLKLEDPVSRYRPEVPNGDNITIEQLLTMRSGLYNYSETLALNDTLDKQPRKSWTPEEVVSLGLKNPPYFPPGTDFHYSNTNTVLLGMIAAERDRKPLPAVLHDRLFAPLGLKNTYLPEITDNRLPEPRTRGYAFGSNVLTMASPPALPADMQAAARAGQIRPGDQTEVNPSWGGAAGAGISTAEDLSVWVRALVEGRLLTPEMQKKRMNSLRPIRPGVQDSPEYGMALAKFGPMYGHTGELPGFNTFMGHDPVNQVTLIVWANLAPSVEGRDPASTIARALMGQIYTRPFN